MNTPNVTPDTLNSVMEFDHIIRVAEDGTVTDSSMSVGSTAAYFELNVTPEGVDEFTLTEGWELLKGYTGQYSYNGPVMHSSEFIGGGMARHILETPGYYVALEVTGRCDYDGTTSCTEDVGCECEPAGWAVAYRPFSDDSRPVEVTHHHGNEYSVTTTTLGELKTRLAREAKHATDEPTRAGRRAYIAAALDSLETSGRGEWGWDTYKYPEVTP